MAKEVKRQRLLRNSEVATTNTKYSRTVVSRWDEGREVYSPDNLVSLVKAYKDFVYVYASKNAVAVAKTGFKLFVAKKYNGRLLVPTRSVSKSTLDYVQAHSSLTIKSIIAKAAKIEEVIEHPFLQLMRKVNPFIEGFTLIELTQLYLELTGNAYWYIFRNAVGIPLQIWIVPAQYMKIVPSKTTFIAGYVYTTMDGKVPFTTDEIIHFKFPNPDNLYYGKAPSSSITDTLNTNENMNKFENSLFSNNCRPEGVLETELELTDESFNRLKSDWKENYSGAERAGKVAILEKGLKYHPITFPPKDLSFTEGRKYNKEVIADAYGIPASMRENANLANAFIGDKQYASYTIVPRLRRLEEGINGRLLPVYDPTLFMVFDNPVPEDKTELLAERVAYLKTGFRTINEYRQIDGLEPVAWGDEPLKQGNNNTTLSDMVNPGAGKDFSKLENALAI